MRSESYTSDADTVGEMKVPMAWVRHGADYYKKGFRKLHNYGIILLRLTFVVFHQSELTCGRESHYYSLKTKRNHLNVMLGLNGLV